MIDSHKYYRSCPFFNKNKCRIIGDVVMHFKDDMTHVTHLVRDSKNNIIKYINLGSMRQKGIYPLLDDKIFFVNSKKYLWNAKDPFNIDDIEKLITDHLKSCFPVLGEEDNLCRITCETWRKKYKNILSDVQRKLFFPDNPIYQKNRVFCRET